MKRFLKLMALCLALLMITVRKTLFFQSSVGKIMRLTNDICCASSGNKMKGGVLCLNSKKTVLRLEEK